MKEFIAAVVLLSVATFGSTHSFGQESDTLEMPTWTPKAQALLDSLSERLTTIRGFTTSGMCPRDLDKESDHGAMRKRLCFYIKEEMVVLSIAVNLLVDASLEKLAFSIGDSLGYDMQAPFLKLSTK